MKTKQTRLVDGEPIFLVPERKPSIRLQRRFIALFRDVWKRIPRQDQVWIVAHAGHHKHGLQVQLSHTPGERTNAWVCEDLGQMWIDAWFVEAATDRLVKAAIAHELGHIRGFTDPTWPDHSEAVACLYAERIWKFHEAEAVFKSHTCLRLDAVARESGGKAQVFQQRTISDGDPLDTFLLLKGRQRLDYGCDLKLERLGDSDTDFEIMASCLRNPGQI